MFGFHFGQSSTPFSPIASARTVGVALIALAGLSPTVGFAQEAPAPKTARPNIVMIFPDNLGIGEVQSYGGNRGVPTPNIDRIADEGIRLTNFNVEYSCAVSRMALLTGRYAPRTGEGYLAGMTLWEETIAEALGSVGYETAIFGKWHVGGANWETRREPTQQGFNEWWGIPRSSSVSQYTSMPGFNPDVSKTPYIWEGKAGEQAKRVKPYTLETRRTIDRELTEHSVEFITRNAKEDKPFFLYLPMTLIHFPALAHPDFAGTTGAGDIGDAMAEVDHNVGTILQTLDRLDIADNTLILWCTDNGAEKRRPWRGSAGPWRGFYNSAMEGGIRTPCVIRWPGRIPPGRVSNELVHQVDLFPTFAAAAGAPEIVPTDRIIDGINQLPFLEGKQERSDRRSTLVIAREGNVMAVKWGDWKLWYAFKPEPNDANQVDRIRLFDLRADPKEETDVKDLYPWVLSAMDGVVEEYEASLIVHPRVPGGIDDPYFPPPRGSGDPVQTFLRTDRVPLGPRSPAMANPDFSGTWTTAILSSAPPGTPTSVVIPTLGSGWGPRVSVTHTEETLGVERVVFVPRDVQPLVRYRFALDGTPTANDRTLGRSSPAPISTTAWDENRLVITTTHSFQDPETGGARTSEVVRTVWLQAGTQTPFESSLVVETMRGSALGGPASTNRTVYVRGAR